MLEIFKQTLRNTFLNNLWKKEEIIMESLNTEY